MSKKKRLLRKQGKTIVQIKKKKRLPKVKVAPEQPRPERPKLGELKDAYKGVVTSDQGQQVASLAMALQWYDKTIAWCLYKKQMSNDHQQIHLDMLTHRKDGAAQATNKGKIKAFSLAIRACELLAEALGAQVVKLEDYLKIVEDTADELQGEEEKLEEKFASVLGVLAVALKPMNAQNKLVKIGVGKIKDAYIIDPELNRITFRKDVVKDMQHMLRREGLLPLFKEVAEPLSRVAALEAEKDLDKHPTGRYHVNMKKQWQVFFQLWDNLIAFAQTEDSPKRLVKRPRELAAAPVDSHKPSTPRPNAFGGKTKEKTLGNYKVGSAGAKLVTLMMDHQWHEKKELAKAVAPRDADDRLDSLKRRGLKYGLWSIETKGTEYKMVPMTSGGQA